MSTTTTTASTSTTYTPQEQVVTSPAARLTLAILRLVVGFIFLWAFIDKVFGLGFTTKPERAWINGGTPAQGFMKNAEGPFAALFQGMAGPWADWLFMIGLLAIGVAVMLGAGLKIAAITGALLMFLMYLAEFPIGRPGAGFTNPIVDSHWIEGLSLVVFALTRAGDTLGVGKIWGRMVGDGWLR
ncbi:thiosulfate dehydrogenase [quinone] large subunit [Raineyella antarctica]|uniref:Thiosulfate dehydrogenase [quinone] large subunit n=1 Tax=Raineyella antarctica TaxID=1577474 RepID=A0A1G6H1Q7_9ACTN|nr:DoxX family protein [Raineyella antarctica]SDB88237.1 thiosulfate dehydrogenase [quinone] large subunit [Raineyella antarctica]